MPEPAGVLGSAIDRAGSLTGAQPGTGRVSITLFEKKNCAQIARGAGSVERGFSEDRPAHGTACRKKRKAIKKAVKRGKWSKCAELVETKANINLDLVSQSPIAKCYSEFIE